MAAERGWTGRTGAVVACVGYDDEETVDNGGDGVGGICRRVRRAQTRRRKGGAGYITSKSWAIRAIQCEGSACP